MIKWLLTSVKQWLITSFANDSWKGIKLLWKHVRGSLSAGWWHHLRGRRKYLKEWGSFQFLFFSPVQETFMAFSNQELLGWHRPVRLKACLDEVVLGLKHGWIEIAVEQGGWMHMCTCWGWGLDARWVWQKIWEKEEVNTVVSSSQWNGKARLE